jgi:hypothetical protein
MQAIETKFIPATNTKPSRIKATCERGILTVSWEHAWSDEDNHREAALALCVKFAQEDAPKTPFDKNPWARPLVSPIPEKLHLTATCE